MDSETPIVNGNASEPAAQVMDYTLDFPALESSGAPAVARPLPPRPAASGWARPGADVKTKFVLEADERSLKGKSFGPNTDEQQRAGKVSKETGTRIELSEARDGTLTVIISGPKAKVDEARAKVIRELQTQATREVVIPKEFHRMLIGKAGDTLKALEAETNTHINIPNRDVASDVIKITGPREGMERAAAHIQRVAAEQAKLATEHIAAARIYYPWVRGPNNELIDDLTSRFSIKINIPPPVSNNEIISITGEREGVLTAAAKIRAIVAEKEVIAKSLTVSINRAQHRYIIGKQRSGIAEILRSTGISVEMPEVDTASDVITLRGDPARLGDALTQVYARASSTITAQSKVPLWMHRLLIGPKGATLSALVPNRAKVDIDFDDSGDIFYEGAPEEVSAAKAAIEAEVARLTKECAMETVKVHPTLHRHVIGRGGALVSKLKDEHGVTINIPDEATNSDEISVEGKKEGVKKAIEEIKALVAKIENEKSKDLIIEQRLHKLIIGQGGKAINELRKQFPSVNFSFPDVNKKSDIINVRGDRKEVDDAAKALQKIAKDLAESNFQDSVPIFKEFYKHIVGKGGSNIKKIREETSTRIDLPDENSEEERIAVTGKKENVEKAIALLQKMQSELASVVTVEIEIPVKVQARMIGGGRRVLFDIEKECGGVYIKFPAEKSESTKVTINGPKEDVEKAQKVLLDLAKDREANFAEDTVKAKPEFHRFIIGKGGARINKIKSAGNVRIMFPRQADADQESIHLLGTKDEVVRAKAELEAIIKQLNETVELKMEVNAKYHVHFKRVGAQLLKEIQDQNGNVVISFPGKAAEDQRTVTIKGIKQCCESAKARIEEIVDDMDHQVTINVEIPAVHHRVLLSNRGQRVQEIQSRHNVRIRFPRRDAGPAEGEEAAPAEDQVAISGRDSACEKAAEDLKALVPISKVIEVPIDAHRFLIGRGGETIRKIMQDNDVSINVPKDEAQSEEITVSGTVEAVDATLEDIRAKLKEYEEQAEDRKLRQWSMTINVPTEYHQKIIGIKGVTVNELRKKHDVNISLPKGEERTDEIVIQGYEDKARACAAEIEAMVEAIRSLIVSEVVLDVRCHPRIIGARGKNVRKIMEDFGVEIKFPRSEGEGADLVTVSGKEENAVLDCVDYLKNLEEDFLAEYSERNQFISHRVQEQPKPAAASKVEIRGAPWQLDISSSAEFPDMGAANPSAAPVVAAGAWGAARRF
ncbi:hypothetical protein PMAYCL1PPCAC_05359 [Pristionchus mayeri]|uniref:K Homology domain-containing protein n=1 Tax=Pristionchus mayeri TaxID=1317129 RepID=A0AAN5CAS2_9BILA|nr:hypothetical protein PMAYCL1PPCAC_05359 [Pristionchus mayeri]